MTSTSSFTAAQVFGAFTRPRKLPANLEEQQALVHATRHVVDYEGNALAAWSWGTGEPVLLLHGWESRASHLAAFVPPLIRAGFRAIALDAPAHGDSQGEVTDVVDFGRAVMATAAHFGPLTSVIAHSIGSAAALHAFGNGVRVQTSVHLSGPASLTRVLHRGAAAAGLDAAGIAQLESMMVEHLAAPLSVMDLSTLRPGMGHPALILHDPEDREMPFSESLALADAWPSSTLSAVHGLGHRRILRDPAVIASAVSFIVKSIEDTA